MDLVIVLFLAGSFAGLLISSLLLKSKLLKQRGILALNSLKEETWRVNYPIRYKQAPHLNLTKRGMFKYTWSYQTTRQDKSGFDVLVMQGNYADHINETRALKWKAAGVVDETQDLRSTWARMTIAEKFFAISTVIGALSAIWQFGEQIARLIQS
jgi:hypothetical protein